MKNDKTLIIITGPTGSGKSALALAVATRIGCQIISADSRQIYKDIPIGTAAPTETDLKQVPHHFVGTLQLTDYYSAAKFEDDVLELLPHLWADSDYAVMCGGSMMYIDAVTNGIDTMPTVSESVRRKAYAIYERGGLDAVRKTLSAIDPDYYAIVDQNNHKRMIHAIELTMEANKPYSEMRTGRRKERPFRILKFAITMPREELFRRINARTRTMIANGLVEEARRVYPLRHLNSVNTVGYKELFDYFDGKVTLDEATEKIARNTRVYAKKQLTWLKKDPNVVYLDWQSDMTEYIIGSL